MKISNNITKAAISAIFPKKCAACSDAVGENDFLCDLCFKSLVMYDPFKRCIKCGLPKKNCDCSRHIFYFDGCIAPFVNSGAAKDAMYALKFRKKLSAAEFFASYMALAVKNEYREINFDAVAYIPLTKKGKFRRGYNQSEILAEKIAEIFGIPVLRNKIISANTNVSQHKLKLTERFENVRGKYTVAGECRGNILLVDDIKTTGATLNECARQLLHAGSSGVWCITGVITERKNKNLN